MNDMIKRWWELNCDMLRVAFWLVGSAMVVIVLSFAIAYGVISLFGSVGGNRQHQVDTCVAAFEYTRLQCEFIVDNKVMP
jgi:hypothetical protein